MVASLFSVSALFIMCSHQEFNLQAVLVALGIRSTGEVWIRQVLWRSSGNPLVLPELLKQHWKCPGFDIPFDIGFPTTWPLTKFSCLESLAIGLCIFVPRRLGNHQNPPTAWVCPGRLRVKSFWEQVGRAGGLCAEWLRERRLPSSPKPRKPWSTRTVRKENEEKRPVKVQFHR